MPAEPAPDPAAQAREEEARLAEAMAAGDLAAVGRWVIEGSSTRIRQQAAHAITDLDQLHELIRASRHGNDKSVYRILTTKRDELLDAARRAQQLRDDLDGAASAIAQHSERPYDVAYEGTLRMLETRWQALAPQASADLRDAVARQLESARAVIESHRQAVAAEAERQRAAALAAEAARQQRELEAEAAAAAAAEQARLREAEQQAEREKHEAEDAEVRHLLGLLRQAQAALDHGGTARAARLREAIAEKLPHAPALPPWFARKLEEVDARLEELKDWKTFTIVPKRAELLQQMQALVGADLSPEELAQHVRRLREQWRTLKRGAGEEETPEWQQFEEAANRAYEPCREHFARQAEQRKENQAKREVLLERLAAFVAAQSGEQADWRLVSQVIVEARNEWRLYAPVDQGVVKDLQARFHALVGQLKTGLDAEYARNVEAKRNLIARTADLLKLEDTRQAIEEAKSLQRTWKSVGPVPRRQDNTLWEEFRRHCDAVFERSSKESAAHGAALETSQARATALCEELERMSELPGDELLAGVPHLNELSAEFESLELPRASARGLNQRFAKAADRCTDVLQQHRAAAVRQGWNDLFAAAALVRAYALATARQGSPDDLETLRTAAAAAIADLAHAPKGTPTILEQALAKIAGGAISTDLAANEAALRLLCVRAELMADLPTPPDDLPLRREYQLQRLVASMGRGERTAPADLDDLALEWITAGPVEPDVHDPLFARFERCRATTSR